MRSSILHSLAATGPVAVVEVDALALEDEGADAVLSRESARVERELCVVIT